MTMQDIKDAINEVGITNFLKMIPLSNLKHDIVGKLSKDKDTKSAGESRQYTLELDYGQCSASDLISPSSSHYRILWQNNLRAKDTSKWPKSGRVTVVVSPAGLSGVRSDEERVVEIIGQDKYNALIDKGMSASGILEMMKATFGDEG